MATSWLRYSINPLIRLLRQHQVAISWLKYGINPLILLLRQHQVATLWLRYSINPLIRLLRQRQVATLVAEIWYEPLICMVRKAQNHQPIWLYLPVFSALAANGSANAARRFPHRLGSKIRNYPLEHVTLGTKHSPIGGLTVALCWPH